MPTSLRLLARQFGQSHTDKFSIDIKIYGSYAKIKFPNKKWEIWQREENVVLLYDGDEKFSFKGIPVIEDESGLFETNCTGLDETLNIVLTHLKVIFPNCQFGLLDVDLERLPENFKVETAFSSISQVEYLKIHGYGEHKESAKYLLENIQATEEVTDNFSHQATETINTALMRNTKELLCGSAGFLHRTDLLSLNNQCVTLAKVGRNVFKPEDLMDFLRRWQYSTTQEVKNFTGMTLKHERNELDLPNLESLGAKQWNHIKTFYLPKVLCCKTTRTRPPCMTVQIICYHTERPRSGWDISRRDGLVMSVIPDGGRTLFLVKRNLPKNPPAPEKVDKY